MRECGLEYARYVNPAPSGSADSMSQVQDIKKIKKRKALEETPAWSDAMDQVGTQVYLLTYSMVQSPS